MIGTLIFRIGGMYCLGWEGVEVVGREGVKVVGRG